MLRNDPAKEDHVCPGICIQTIDMVQPPGMGISPIAVMDAHHMIVSAALPMNSNAETAKKPRWEIRAETIINLADHCFLLAFASALSFRKASSPALDTWTHFGLGEASAS